MISDSQSSLDYILKNTTDISKHILLAICKAIIKNYIDDILNSINNTPVVSYFSTNLVWVLASIIKRYPHLKVILFKIDLMNLQYYLDSFDKMDKESFSNILLKINLFPKDTQGNMNFISYFLKIIYPLDPINTITFIEVLLEETNIYVPMDDICVKSHPNEYIDFSLILLLYIFDQIENILNKELSLRIPFSDLDSTIIWNSFSHLITKIIEKEERFKSRNKKVIIIQALESLINLLIKAIIRIDIPLYERNAEIINLTINLQKILYFKKLNLINLLTEEIPDLYKMHNSLIQLEILKYIRQNKIQTYNNQIPLSIIQLKDISCTNKKFSFISKLDYPVSEIPYDPNLKNVLDSKIYLRLSH